MTLLLVGLEPLAGVTEASDALRGSKHILVAGVICLVRFFIHAQKVKRSCS